MARRVVADFAVAAVVLVLLVSPHAQAQYNAKLTIRNTTSGEIDAYYVHPLLQAEQKLGSVKAGESLNADTNLGTVWVLRNPMNDREVARFRITQPNTVQVIKAPPGVKPLNVTFTNQARFPVNVFWVNDSGTEESYGTIQPGQTMKRPTFTTHQWVFRNARTNQVVKQETTNREGQNVVIRGGKGPPPPPDGDKGGPDRKAKPKKNESVNPKEPDIGGPRGSLTPVDASSAERYPNVLPFLNSSAGLDIAWTSKTGAIYVSSFSGTDWKRTRTIRVGGALNILGGFCEDDKGNMYLLSHKEEANPGSPPAFRRGISQIHTLSGENQTPALVVDLNSKTHISDDVAAIFNPLGDKQRNTGTSRLTLANGNLVPMFTHNWAYEKNGTFHQRGHLFAVKTAGNNVYNGGGYWDHCADLKLLVTGKDVVVLQVNENGLGISKLSLSGSAKWSGIQRVAEMANGHDSRLRIGGLSKTAQGYLLAYTYGKTGAGSCMWDPKDSEVKCQEDVYVMTVANNVTDEGLTVEKIQQVGPYINSQPVHSSAAARQLVDYSSSGQSGARRLQFVDLKNGKFLLVWEKWTNIGAPASYSGTYDSTWAMVVNAQGRQQVAPKSLGKLRIQKNTDAIYLPGQGVAGWLAGDAAKNRLLLHTVNQSLQTTTTALPLEP